MEGSRAMKQLWQMQSECYFQRYFGGAAENLVSAQHILCLFEFPIPAICRESP